MNYSPLINGLLIPSSWIDHEFLVYELEHCPTYAEITQKTKNTQVGEYALLFLSQKRVFFRTLEHYIKIKTSFMSVSDIFIGFLLVKVNDMEISRPRQCTIS